MANLDGVLLRQSSFDGVGSDGFGDLLLGSASHNTVDDSESDSASDGADGGSECDCGSNEVLWARLLVSKGRFLPNLGVLTTLS